MMDHIKVLIVDDDAVLGATLTLGLETLGMQPIYQTSLAGLQAVVESSHPNIILLDVEVGENNSIEQMRQIKLYAPNTPVIFMTSHVDAGYLTKAIGEGAVAFLKKPFEMEEVAAYIQRFAQMDDAQDAATMISIGKYSLNINSRDLFFDGKSECRLTAKQFQVIRFLLKKSGEDITRQALKKELWSDGNASDASLDNYISQLRKILAKDAVVQIVTIPKIGFRLDI